MRIVTSLLSHEARDEWRGHYRLPLAAALGYATSVIHIYGLGPYIQPIGDTFGWSRTQITAGLTIATITQALCAVPLGLLVDRIGPRRLGVAGIALTSAAFALLATASGQKANWLLLWVLLALATIPVQALVWTSAVASRFSASRGMALAVTLCGASLAAALFPPLGTWLIATHGWRAALGLQGGLWFLLAFPAAFLFFRGARDEPSSAKLAAPTADAASDIAFLDGIRSTIYLRLLVASLLFAFTLIGLVVHFVPILSDRGASPAQAALTASIVGIASVVGRLGTGVLLDRFEGARVGATVFLLPAIGCLILLLAGGTWPLQLTAAAFIGLTLGAEVDVIVYLTTRYFGLKSFGALYGGLLIALSLGTAAGPLTAAFIYDREGAYSAFLWLSIAFMMASSAVIFGLPSSRTALPDHR